MGAKRELQKCASSAIRQCFGVLETNIIKCYVITLWSWVKIDMGQRSSALPEERTSLTARTHTVPSQIHRLYPTKKEEDYSPI